LSLNVLVSLATADGGGFRVGGEENRAHVGVVAQIADRLANEAMDRGR